MNMTSWAMICLRLEIKTWLLRENKQVRGAKDNSSNLIYHLKKMARYKTSKINMRTRLELC
jgi:hypothetical protein